MNPTHSKNEEIFLRLHVRNLCIHSSVYFRLVCAEMFSSVLLRRNFDLINFWADMCGCP